MTTDWQSLIANLAVMALIIHGWSLARHRLEPMSRPLRRAAFGLVMGFGAIVSLLMSVELQPGIFIDFGSSLIAISGLLGGPVAALVAASISIIGHTQFASSVTWPGMLEIVLVAICGLVGHLLIARRDTTFTDVLLLAGAIVGINLLSIAMLPAAMALTPLIQAGPLALGLSFLATVLSGFYILQAQRQSVERDLLRAAHVQAPDFHYVKNCKSQFVAVNKMVATHNGFEHPDEMVGKSDFDIAPMDRAQDLFTAEQEILCAGAPLLNYEERVVDETGTESWFVTTKVPIRSRNGEIIGLTGVTNDVTERKRLEGDLLASSNRLSYALAEMSDGLAMFDSEGYLVFCNEQYRSAFPLTADMRTPGVNYREILVAMLERGEAADMPADKVDTWVEDICKSLEVESTRDIQLLDGRWLQWRSRPTSSGAAMVVVSDITKAKRMEIMKDEFISTVSHELRTPLTSIQGSLGLLMAKSDDSADEKTLKLLKLSYDNCQRLTRLVNDILDIEKIAAGKMTYLFEVVDVCALVSNIVDGQVSHANLCGVEFALHFDRDEIFAELDKDRFHQALVNLLSNAIKFSAPGQKIYVGVHAKSDMDVQIVVRDKGPGIPKAFQDKVFEKFAQADGSATRVRGGSGLGLNITKSIIEALNGTVSFTTEEGVGTTFEIDLPSCAPEKMKMQTLG